MCGWATAECEGYAPGTRGSEVVLEGKKCSSVS